MLVFTFARTDLFDFEVEEGLGYGCDEDTIRLLKEAPEAEGAGQEATYSVRFQIMRVKASVKDLTISRSVALLPGKIPE